MAPFQERKFGAVLALDGSNINSKASSVFNTTTNSLSEFLWFIELRVQGTGWFDTMFLWVWFGVFHCLPNSAWAGENWAEAAWQTKVKGQSSQIEVNKTWSQITLATLYRVDGVDGTQETEII